MKLNKDALYIAAIVILIALCGQFYYTYHWQPAHEVRVYYSKETEANERVIDTIQEADRFVYFGIYTFTREDIRDALLAAKYRGLDVRGVVDREQTENIEGQRKIVKALRDHEIPVYEHTHSAIMHVKLVVTDKAYASGSYNWTKAATESNDEVIEVGTNEKVRRQYQEVLETLLRKYRN